MRTHIIILLTLLQMQPRHIPNQQQVAHLRLTHPPTASFSAQLRGREISPDELHVAGYLFAACAGRGAEVVEAGGVTMNIHLKAEILMPIKHGPRPHQIMLRCRQTCLLLLKKQLRYQLRHTHYLIGRGFGDISSRCGGCLTHG